MITFKLFASTFATIDDIRDFELSGNPLDLVCISDIEEIAAETLTDAADKFVYSSAVFNKFLEESYATCTHIYRIKNNGEIEQIA